MKKQKKEISPWIMKAEQGKKGGNEKETVHRGLLLFKYTFDKGARHSTEKANKKAKYSRNILNSQKTVQSESQDAQQIIMLMIKGTGQTQSE